MPIFGARAAARTNRVLSGAVVDGNLVNYRGRISLTRAMDRATTATIEATDVPPSALSSVLKNPGDRVSVFGEELLVESCSYSVNRYYPNDSKVEVYNVSISLKQEEKDIEIWNGNGGNFVLLPEKMRVVDGQNSKVLFTGGYRDAELTFGTEEQEQAEEPEEGAPRTIFRLKNRRTETFEEGDDDPEIPPANTYVLRDFSSNFDETGPKKMIKTAKRVDGQMDSEKITTYGFAYLARQLQYADGEDLYDDDPDRFWVPIEEKNTTYFYERAGSTTFSVRVQPPGDSANRSPVRFLVHPDYQQFAEFNTDGISFRSNAEYLVRQVTTGWKLVRFIKEPYTDSTSADVDADDPLLPLFNFVRIPFYAETLYALRSTRREFEDNENIALPFRIEWTDYNSLPILIQSVFSRNDVTDDGRVAILYPDPNYIEPMFISAESSMSNSFDWRLNPEEEADPDQFIPGTNRAAPPPRFLTGEESYSAVRRKIVNADRYTEYIVNYSSQDPGFDNSAEQFSFREVSGTPPEPQYRTRQYEAVEVPSGQILLSSSTTKKYTITALIDKRMSEFVPEGGSVSIPEAETEEDARKKVELELIKSYALNSPSSVTDLGFNSRIKPGDSCSAGERLPGESPSLVIGVTATVEFNGRNNVTGDVLATTPGTVITVGPSEKPEIDIRMEEQLNPSEQEQRFEESIDVDIESTPSDVGSIFPNLPTRRNF